MIDSVAKTFDSGIAPFSVATAGINACQLLLCQLSSVTLTRNHGGSVINKYVLRAWTYGSYICRNSHSFWSVANPSRTVTPVSASAFRKAFKLEGGRRSGSDAGGELTKTWASSAATRRALAKVRCACRAGPPSMPAITWAHTSKMAVRAANHDWV